MPIDDWIHFVDRKGRNDEEPELDERVYVVWRRGRQDAVHPAVFEGREESGASLWRVLGLPGGGSQQVPGKGRAGSEVGYIIRWCRDWQALDDTIA